MIWSTLPARIWALFAPKKSADGGGAQLVLAVRDKKKVDVMRLCIWAMGAKLSGLSAKPSQVVDVQRAITTISDAT